MKKAIIAGIAVAVAHGVSFANCTFRPVRPREGLVADREAGKLSGDGAGAIRIERADGVSFRACALRWDGNADPGVTRATTSSAPTAAKRTVRPTPLPTSRAS